MSLSFVKILGNGVFAGLLMSATVNGATADTLRDVIQYGIENNPRVTAAQATQRATESVLKQARSRFLPEVNVSASAGRQIIDRPEGFGPLVNKTWRTRQQASVSIRQVLFDGFDRINDVYRSRARISAAEQKTVARSELVALNIVEAYIDVIRHNRLLKLANDNVVRHRRLLSLVNERAKGGQTGDGDLQQTKERLEAARALVSQIKISLGTSIAKFRSSVGKKPNRLHAVGPAKHLPRTADEAYQIALRSNPQVKASQADIDTAEFDRAQFRSNIFPQIYLEGKASRGLDIDGTPGKSNEVSGMVVFNWKLFDGGVRRHRINELDERTGIKMAEYDELLRDIRQQIDVAWVRHTEGGRQVSSVRRQLNQTIKVVNAYRSEYQANKRSLLDVLDAESTRFASEFDLSNARSIQVFSSYQLLAGMGQLLQSFNIDPPTSSLADVSTFGFTTNRKAFQNFKIPSLRSE